MNKLKNITTKKLILILVVAFLVCGLVIAGVAFWKNRVQKVVTDDKFEYVNPDETQAEADTGFAIDGVFDEEQYQDNNWLYLHNTDESSDVDVAMTSHFGEKGMYFAFDVTDRKPIYVNLDRNSPLNSGIEMYLAPNSVLTNKSNYLFEIDLMPTGDMVFKKTNGKGGFTYVTKTNDIMPYLGATTKGGEVNTPECTGYNLELFIPWEYMETFDISPAEMKDSYVYVNPAHITSFNYDGTNSKLHRYWYCFGEQHGATLDTVYQYFRFNGEGVIGTSSTTIEETENCSVVGDKTVYPGMKSTYTITPKEGYAINSVLVNGKEYIQNVSYSENGNVLLTVWGKTEGLVIKATAEPIIAGNKTLSGTVDIGDDSLKGVTVSYMGVNGKKTITLDSKGKFKLTDLPQGYYTITVEKEGYATIERGIYLSRDVVTKLSFVKFVNDTGKSWIKEDTEDGVIRKFGGRGIVLTNASYEKFTVDVNLQYDEALAKEYAHDFFTQQRQGIRIKFSNGKIWDINIYVNNSGVYQLQYPAFAGKNAVFDSYKTIYHLTEKEIELYKSKAGLQLKVIRDGKYANVLLNDKVIAIEELGNEYAKCSAQVGFSAWIANRVVKEYKYSITTDTKNIKKQKYFDAAGGWDVSTQHDGYISLQKGGLGVINFAQQYGNIDLTLKVRDYQNSTDEKGVYARTDVLFVFENGAHISFGILRPKNGNRVVIESVNRVADDGKQIYTRGTKWGSNLTAEEMAQYHGEGLDFRIVRNGTNIYLFVNDREITSFPDLTNNKSGVTADMKARMTIRHFDDTGVEVVIPFKVNTQFNPVDIKTVKNTNGEVSIIRNDYLVGDKITITGKGNEGYYCKAMKVNGKEVAINYDGTYTFTATEKSYTVEGVFAEGIFSNSQQWDVLKQNEGILSIPNGGTGTVQLSKPYKDIDLSIKVKDVADEANTVGATDILFKFENGAYISFRTTLGALKPEGDLKISAYNYGNKKDDGKQIYNYSKPWATLSDELKQQFLDTGVDIRVVRTGTNIYLYADGNLVNIANLNNNKDYPVTADMLATIEIRHWNDSGVQVDVPFTVSDTVKSVDGTVTLSHVANDESTVSYVLANAVTNMDLTLAVKRNTEVKNTSEKYDVLLEFANGKNLSFYIGMEKIGGVGTSDWRVATLNKAADKDNADKLVYNRGTVWGSLDADEKDAFINSVLNFRILRDGTDILLYLDDRYIGTADLTNNDSGINADTTMKVTVRHYDDTDKTAVVEIPFALGRYPETVIINTSKSNNGKVTVDKKKCIYGDTITITGKGNEGYYCKAMKVNGEEVAINYDGTYTFIATEKSYTAEGVFAEGTFSNSQQWDVLKQNEGILSIPNGGTGTVQLSKPYKDIDLTIKVKDVADEANTVGATDILFKFENGAYISFRTTLGGLKPEGDLKISAYNYGNGKDDGKQIYNYSKPWATLSNELKQQYLNTGVDIRVVRTGTHIYLYADGMPVAIADLNNNENYPVTEDMLATVEIRHWNDSGVQVDVPFTVSDTVKSVEGKVNFVHAYDGVTPKLTTEKKVLETAVTDLDLTLTTKRHTLLKNNTEKFDILLEFANGKNISFYLGMVGGKWSIASLNLYANDNANADKNIYARDTVWHTLTSAQQTSFTGANSSLDFRIVRTGTNVFICLGEQYITTVDLTNNSTSGVTAETKIANVTIRHYGQPTTSATTAGVPVAIPFEMSKTVDDVAAKLNFVHAYDGVTPKLTTEKEVLVRAVTDLDLTLTTKRHTLLKNTTEKFDILLEFANGKNISFYLGMVSGKWSIASLNLYANNNANADKNIYARDTVWHTLTSAQQTSFTNNSLNFRIKRTGTDVLICLGEEHIATVDLTNNSASGVTAETKITSVTIRHYGQPTTSATTDGVPVEIPFQVSQTVAPASLLKSNFILWVRKKLAV